MGWNEPSLNALSWLGAAVERSAQLRISVGGGPNLLVHYLSPSAAGIASWQEFWQGRFGQRSWRSWSALSWSTAGCTEAEETPTLPGALGGLAPSLPFPFGPTPTPSAGLDLLPTWILGDEGPPEPALIDANLREPCPAWQRPTTVTMVRYGGEADTFRLLDCDGSVAIEAVDRLSALARPPLTARPELPLPSQPDPNATNGEWIDNVKMVHPRLVWLVAQVSAAFPRKWIYVVSGYRRGAHGSYHRRGRALDLFVMGVPNEALFGFCRRLRDVGCGYYPNSSFVHLDVRPYGTGHPVWIDTAHPGERSAYVDQWPGLIGAGALTGAGEE